MGKKGFTLIELMIVVLIVAILAAVALPLMMNRVESAKWSEAKAAMGSIATNLKAFYAEKGCATTWTPVISVGTTITEASVGISTVDLDGTYFANADYTLGTPACTNGVVTADISCAGGTRAGAPTGTVHLHLRNTGIQEFTGP